MTHRALTAGLAGIVAVLAACASPTRHTSISSSASAGGSGPNQSSSSNGSSSGTGAGNGGIVFKASGPATVQALDIDINNQTYAAWQGLHMPWTDTVQFQAGWTSYALRVQGESPSPAVTCEIDVPGKSPVKLTAGTGQTTVLCQAS